VQLCASKAARTSADGLRLCAGASGTTQSHSEQPQAEKLMFSRQISFPGTATGILPQQLQTALAPGERVGPFCVPFRNCAAKPSYAPLRHGRILSSQG